MRRTIAGVLSRKDVLLLMVFGCLAMILLTSLTKTQEAPKSRDGGSFVSDDYERGFVNGYRAFREQSDSYVPSEQYAPVLISHQYSSSHWSALETRGYVDGYHKATEMQNCPVEGSE